MRKNVDAGMLRHRVTLLRDSGSTSNSVGQVPPAYSPVGTYYALVEPLGALEAVNANQLKGLIRYRVTLRASAGPIYPSDRFTWKGRTLNVVGAVTDPFGILIEVDATEKGVQ